MDKLIKDLMKLDVLEFMGVVTMMGVDVGTADNVRPFDKVLDELLWKIQALNRKQRRNLAKIVAAAAKDVKPVGDS